jgi:subtilase family serine protease
MKTRFVYALAASLLFVLAGTSPAQDWVYRQRPPHVQVKQSSIHRSITNDCEGLVIGGQPFVCYEPAQVRAAYDYPSGLTGTGQTIVIIDAYGSPTIKTDLALFDAVFGVPAPPSFTVVCPQGCPAVNVKNSPHDDAGWTIETSLDVEWSHAMAPGANLVLVVAATNSGNALNLATQYAIQQYPGSVISQSFGVPEFLVRGNNAQLMQAHANFVAAVQRNITMLASAGDNGATNGASLANASFPSSDPLVTAVGGTEGLPYPTGLVVLSGSALAYGGEQVWNEPQFDAATGGAPSLLFEVPSFQSGLGLPRRTTPDVSYNAAVNGGVLVYDSTLDATSFYIVGGTSAGSPQWAAIVALANQYAHNNGFGPLGYINPALYALGKSSSYGLDFHDITVGNNALNSTIGFSAHAGWDDASGWGTPDVSSLIPTLVGLAHH